MITITDIVVHLRPGAAFRIVGDDLATIDDVEWHDPDTTKPTAQEVEDARPQVEEALEAGVSKLTSEDRIAALEAELAAMKQRVSDAEKSIGSDDAEAVRG